jgi:hypothetical protein
MKTPFSQSDLPQGSLFFLCSSHEERCLGIVQNRGNWRPRKTVVFHYDDPNPRREVNHALLRDAVGSSTDLVEVPFAERDAANSLMQQRNTLVDVLTQHEQRPVVMDVSVFTKRHLLLLLRWLDDYGGWERLWIVYTEPEEYEIEGQLPLSFGISGVEHLAGFPSSPDPSRPLHVAMFLGYEGDRAFATYELLQPRKTTLIIPDPPFREAWRGRTEQQNRNLLAVVEKSSVVAADSLDPESSASVLERAFGPVDSRSEFSRALCPLGTKPQIFGAYTYLRRCVDPPAVIYTGALRHNHSFYSRGVGTSWLIHRPS